MHTLTRSISCVVAKKKPLLGPKAKKCDDEKVCDAIKFTKYPLL
jgi:hypothetical protein